MPVNSQQHQQQQQQPQQQPQQQQQQQRHHQQHQQQQQQQQYQVSSSTPSSSSEAAQKGPHQPCQRLHYDPSQSVDYNNPCASGGCLASPDCSSGACRLEQLGGRWVCCSCGRGGNVYRWCCHPMRKSPDTFCYHVCCAACTPDPDVVGGEAGDHDGDGDEQVF